MRITSENIELKTTKYIVSVSMFSERPFFTEKGKLFSVKTNIRKAEKVCRNVREVTDLLDTTNYIECLLKCKDLIHTNV